ncbi:MAG: electron transport complex subunit RsxC [Oscillospiraceae bacterium]
MQTNSSIIKQVGRSRGGANPGHFKNTADFETMVMPAPKYVVIAMQQHIGAPCVPCVSKGDPVFVGTVIGDSERFVSAPIHSSVSGMVAEIGSLLLPSGQSCQTVKIESDGLMTLDPEIAPVKVTNEKELCEATRRSGLVGLGGAGFPAHVKLHKTEDKPLDTLIINGAECEPFITSDYRECIENSNDVLEGVYLLKKIMGFKNVIIGIEDNKPDAIRILRQIAQDRQDTNNSVNVMKLKSRYPQGAEKVLIYSATGRLLPFGKLPADVGCVVMNITSVAFLNRYIKTGIPLISKRLTIDGSAVVTPGNVMVPIGVSIKEVLDFCGGLNCEPQKVLMGGPMMGLAVLDLNTPVLKQNNAILAFNKDDSVLPESSPCIRCGRCAKACPMNLMPAAIETSLKLDMPEELKSKNVSYCIECGCCSYVCPAKRPLTQNMRLAKAKLRNL